MLTIYDITRPITSSRLRKSGRYLFLSLSIILGLSACSSIVSDLSTEAPATKHKTTSSSDQLTTPLPQILEITDNALQSAQEIINNSSDNRERGNIQLQIALAKVAMGEKNAAVPLFRLARNELMQVTPAWQRIDLLKNMTQELINAGLLDEALQNAQVSNNRALVAEILTYRALEIAPEDRAKAKEIFNQIKDISLEISDAWSRDEVITLTIIKEAQAGFIEDATRTASVLNYPLLNAKLQNAIAIYFANQGDVDNLRSTSEKGLMLIGMEENSEESNQLRDEFIIRLAQSNLTREALHATNELPLGEERINLLINIASVTNEPERLEILQRVVEDIVAIGPTRRTLQDALYAQVALAMTKAGYIEEAYVPALAVQNGVTKMFLFFDMSQQQANQGREAASRELYNEATELWENYRNAEDVTNEQRQKYVEIIATRGDIQTMLNELSQLPKSEWNTVLETVVRALAKDGLIPLALKVADDARSEFREQLYCNVAEEEAKRTEYENALVTLKKIKADQARATYLVSYATALQQQTNSFCR